jgi:hypothetical protein
MIAANQHETRELGAELTGQFMTKPAVDAKQPAEGTSSCLKLEHHDGCLLAPTEFWSVGQRLQYFRYLAGRKLARKIELKPEQVGFRALVAARPLVVSCCHSYSPLRLTLENRRCNYFLPQQTKTVLTEPAQEVCNGNCIPDTFEDV